MTPGEVWCVVVGCIVLVFAAGQLWEAWREHRRRLVERHLDEAIAVTMTRHPASRPLGPDDDPAQLARIAELIHRDGGR